MSGRIGQVVRILVEVVIRLVQGTAQAPLPNLVGDSVKALEMKQDAAIRFPAQVLDHMILTSCKA